jgi:NADH:ubiquinone oxidoreductase subunit 3 (subunit A)
MADQEITINETTTVSLFAVLSALSVVLGVVFMFALTYYRTDANAEKLRTHDAAIEKINDNYIQIVKDLAEIKGLLQGRK